MLHSPNAEEYSSVFTTDYMVNDFWLNSKGPKNSVTTISVTGTYFIFQSSTMILRATYGIMGKISSPISD
jgi:hypothetical protein